MTLSFASFLAWITPAQVPGSASHPRPSAHPQSLMQERVSCSPGPAHTFQNHRTTYGTGLKPKLLRSTTPQAEEGTTGEGPPQNTTLFLAKQVLRSPQKTLPIFQDENEQTLDQGLSSAITPSDHISDHHSWRASCMCHYHWEVRKRYSNRK